MEPRQLVDLRKGSLVWDNDLGFATVEFVGARIRVTSIRADHRGDYAWNEYPESEVEKYITNTVYLLTNEVGVLEEVVKTAITDMVKVRMKGRGIVMCPFEDLRFRYLPLPDDDIRKLRELAQWF